MKLNAMCVRACVCTGTCDTPKQEGCWGEGYVHVSCRAGEFHAKSVYCSRWCIHSSEALIIIILPLGNPIEILFQWDSPIPQRQYALITGGGGGSES